MNKTKYIVVDWDDRNNFRQMNTLDELRKSLTEMADNYDMLENGYDFEDLEVTVIKVPPNSKAVRMEGKLKVEYTWEIKEADA